MRSPHKRQSGFTLLELLMVVIIIAILASIALPQYIKASEKARSTEALSALGAIRSSELRYKALSQNSIYTNNLAELDFEVSNSNNPQGNLTSWGSVNGNIQVSGTTPAVGFAQYQRTGGQYNGEVVGIQFGTGTICGNFEPLGINATCAQD